MIAGDTGPPALFSTVIAVRGLPHPAERPGARDPAQPLLPPSGRGSDLVLVLDTETRTDHTQRLLFGSARLYGPTGFLREWLFYPDDLVPHELAVLTRYVAGHADDGGGHLRLLPAAEFTRLAIGRLAYKEKVRVVGFNLPFDLSRLALDWRPAGDQFAGGFSLRLFAWSDAAGVGRRDLHLPNLRIKAMGSKRQRMAFAAAARIEDWHLDAGRVYRGRFLDLHQLAYALTDRAYSLEAAAFAFGLAERKGSTPTHGVLTERYIDYNRQDVRTTYALYVALTAEWRSHPIELAPEHAYSAASVGRAYLAAMGIRPLLERSTVPDAQLGYTMSAYFGGRAEVRIRRTPMPVRYVDFTAMYPTVFELLGLWGWLTAARLTSHDATDAARDLVASLDADALFNPKTWPALAGVFCLVQPDGDLLPARADYAADPASGQYALSGAPTIGLNPLSSSQPLWYTLADVVAAKILGGKVPAIIEAFRVVPEGMDAGLKPVELRGEIVVDPRRESLFRVAIEERNRLKHLSGPGAEQRSRTVAFLKTLANADAYGIFAQMDVGEPVADGTRVEVDGLWHFETRVATAERPGPYCYPPLAATVTGAGRLLLALAQCEVEHRGGTYLACDTDSLLIVAHHDGGLVRCQGGAERLPNGEAAVRALSDPHVDAVIERFADLSPYARDAVPSLLKLEDENLAGDGSGRRADLWGIGISAKRFVLYERVAGGYVLRKSSEHGLGLYRRPVPDGAGWDKPWPRWIEVVWRRIIDEVEGRALAPAPDWFARPAVGQITTSTWGLLAPFLRHDQHLPPERRVRPSNFMLVGHVDPMATLPIGLAGQNVTPVAPYSSRPWELLRLPWIDRVSGRSIEVTTARRGAPGRVRLRTLGEVVRDYRFHPERKSADHDGGPCLRNTAGYLPRRPVRATMVRHIGKESNRLEEVAEGAISEIDEVQITYVDERAEWVAALPVLREIGVNELARRTAMSQRTLRSRLNSGRMPHSRDRRTLVAVAARIGAPSDHP